MLANEMERGRNMTGGYCHINPSVSLGVSNYDNLSPAEQAAIDSALDVERAQIEDDISDYKAWPVISLGFVYNF